MRTLPFGTVCSCADATSQTGMGAGEVKRQRGICVYRLSLLIVVLLLVVVVVVVVVLHTCVYISVYVCVYIYIYIYNTVLVQNPEGRQGQQQRGCEVRQLGT